MNSHQFKRLSIRPASQAPLSNEHSENSKIAVSTQQSSADKCLEFATIEELRNFVTPRWNERWVTTSIYSQGALDVLLHRPFFLLISIDAPVYLRWSRFKLRCTAKKLDGPSLHDFVQRSDEHLFTPVTGLAALLQHAQLRLLNATSTIDDLHKALRQLDIPNEARLRPNWDQYFMQLAALAAHRSNCMKRRVGCVLVREKRVISTGYNGTPRGLKNCNEGGCKPTRKLRKELLIITMTIALLKLLGAKTWQVIVATVDCKSVLDYPPVFVCTPKKMLYSKQAEKE